MSTGPYGIDVLAGDFVVREKTVAVGFAAPTQIVAQDPSRWLLHFAAEAGDTVRVSTRQNPGGSVGALITGLTGLFPLIFRLHGGLVQSAWTGIALGHSSNVQVFEVLYLPLRQA
jgi:hypothetical protein